MWEKRRAASSQRGEVLALQHTGTPRFPEIAAPRDTFFSAPRGIKSHPHHEVVAGSGMAKNYDAYNTTSCPLPISPTTANTTPEPETVVSNDASTAVGALILSLVFLLGVPGNVFVIWSILARARKLSVTMLLILNLAFADGCLMALTIFFVIYLAKRSWVFGNAMCKMLFYLCNTNMYASIMLIMLMSLHRLVAVMWPHRLHAVSGRRTILRLLLGLWVLVFVMAIPAVVFRKEEQDKNRTICNANHSNSAQVVFQYTFETVMGFVVPYALIVLSYVCILRRLRQTKFYSQIRSEKLIMAIVVTFGIFWLPYHIINVIQVGLHVLEFVPEILTHISKSCRAVTSSLAFISSCANPVLYTFAGKSYIQKNGLSFMARLFEGTALDSGTRKNHQRNRARDGLNLKEKEADSSTSVSIEKNKV
ncbi:leukotriene B4 receptor 1-like [Arapaima gigas]